MSTFITKEDYQGHIRDNRLDQITHYDDTLLAKCETRAINLIKGYLSSRYLVDDIFSATGDDRDDQVLGITVDIALYFLHRTSNPKKVPEFRKEAYDEAKLWLEAVQMSEINPTGLPKPTDGTKDYVRYGSNPKRENHI